MKPIRMILNLLVLFFFAAALAGIASCKKKEAYLAEALMVDAQGKAVGTVRIDEKDSVVYFHLDLHDLPPGMHAMHVHESGSFTPPAFDQAGGHFNPGNKEHGINNPNGYHAGDLPNIWVRKDGTCKDLVYSADLTLKEGAPNSLLKAGGTSLIIHANPDDFVTDPVGNAGDRIAGGIIAKVKKK